MNTAVVHTAFPWVWYLKVHLDLYDFSSIPVMQNATCHAEYNSSWCSIRLHTSLPTWSDTETATSDQTSLTRFQHIALPTTNLPFAPSLPPLSVGSFSRSFWHCATLTNKSFRCPSQPPEPILPAAAFIQTVPHTLCPFNKTALLFDLCSKSHPSPVGGETATKPRCSLKFNNLQRAWKNIFG
jgi:hypothetical protein